MRISVAGVTDISDRAARDLGEVRAALINTANVDGDLNTDTTWKGQDGTVPRLWTRPAAFNGSTWDRVRNLQAGAPGFALGVGGPQSAAVYGNRAFSASRFQAGGGAGDDPAIAIHRPGAGISRVVVTSVEVLVSAAVEIDIRINTGLPGAGTADNPTVSTNRRAVSTTAPTALISRWATAAFAGGDIIRRHTSLALNTPYVFDVPVNLDTDLEPLSVQALNLGAGTLTVSFDWYEE